jgi:hypothetical protein
MTMKIIIAAVAGLGLTTGAAFAGSSAVNGAAGGAVTGAIVGGPVGAAVGGVTGAIVGAAIDPPPEKVVTYVQEQPAPANDVIVQDRVAVGEALPEAVVVTPVPDNPDYAYAVVNHERVIVQPKTRKVVKVVE